MDNKTQLSAHDCVYAITSILESPYHMRQDIVPELQEEGKSRQKKEEDQEDEEEKKEDMVQEHFWEAYDAVTNLEKLRKGIDLAKATQKIIMETG